MKEMKMFIGLIGIMLLMVSIVSARGKVTRDVSLLPVEAQEMIKTYFPKAPVSYMKIDKNLFRTEGYDVFLSDGTELEFDAKGRWTEVESRSQSVPDSLVPMSIRKYVGRYYDDQKVKKIKHDRHGYELELVNGLELKFDNRGKFLRLDD